MGGRRRRRHPQRRVRAEDRSDARADPHRPDPRTAAVLRLLPAAQPTPPRTPTWPRPICAARRRAGRSAGPACTADPAGAALARRHAGARGAAPRPSGGGTTRTGVRAALPAPCGGRTIRSRPGPAAARAMPAGRPTERSSSHGVRSGLPLLGHPLVHDHLLRLGRLDLDDGIILGDVFRRRDIGGWTKALWCVFLIVLPFLGGLVYLIAQHDHMASRDAEQSERAEAQLDDRIRGVASGGGGAASELAKGADLRDRGVISAEEYEALKPGPGRPPAAPPERGAAVSRAARPRAIPVAGRGSGPRGDRPPRSPRGREDGHGRRERPGRPRLRVGLVRAGGGSVGIRGQLTGRRESRDG